MSPTEGKFPLAHHFKYPQQQLDSNKLGMWLFLGQEVLFFSGVFCAYTVYRWLHPEVFVEAHHFLDVKWGAINTGILLFSSLTVALAIRSAQINKQGQIKMYLLLTIACAFGFMIIKYIEYSHKFHVGLLPGQYFTAESHLIPNPDQVQQFFGIYFTMTALHGLHVVVGIGVLAWMYVRTSKGEFGPHNYAALEISGLYWHIVDIIWIFLFPLLYLIH